MNIRNVLDEISKLDITHHYNTTHKICPEYVENFLSRYNEPDKTYCRYIIENTKYVTYNEFTEKLFGIIDILIERYKQFNIFFVIGHNNKIGSEHWLVALIWHKIKDYVAHIITSFDINSKIENDYPVVHIDDAIYSGCNMTMHFDNIIYYGLVGEKNKFIIATPYVSHAGLCTLYSLNEEMIDRVELLTPFEDVRIRSDWEIDYIREYREKYDITEDYRYKHFQLETDCNVPIYFDHKIANEFASFPFIYYNIIENDSHFRDPIEVVLQYIEQYKKVKNI